MARPAAPPELAREQGDDLVPEAVIFDLGQVNPAASLDLAYKAHVVGIKTTTQQGARIIFQNDHQGKTPVKSGEIDVF